MSVTKVNLDRWLLEGAVDKWYQICFANGVDRGGQNCPLCQHYNEYCCTTTDGEPVNFNDLIDNNENIHRCPVFEESELSDCQNTPYDQWNRYVKARTTCARIGREKRWEGWKVSDLRSLYLAFNEYCYLKRLLEERSEDV